MVSRRVDCEHGVLEGDAALVKAALTTSGVAVTVGQALEPVRLLRWLCSTSYMGNQMALSGFLLCLVASRL